MPWEVRECKLSATSDGGSTGADGRLADSIEDAIAQFETDVAPSSIDGVSTRKTGPNRCAVVITYTA